MDASYSRYQVDKTQYILIDKIDFCLTAPITQILRLWHYGRYYTLGRASELAFNIPHTIHAIYNSLARKKVSVSAILSKIDYSQIFWDFGETSHLHAQPTKNRAFISEI